MSDVSTSGRTSEKDDYGTYQASEVNIARQLSAEPYIARPLGAI